MKCCLVYRLSIAEEVSILLLIALVDYFASGPLLMQAGIDEQGLLDGESSS